MGKNAEQIAFEQKAKALTEEGSSVKYGCIVLTFSAKEVAEGSIFSNLTDEQAFFFLNSATERMRGLLKDLGEKEVKNVSAENNP